MPPRWNSNTMQARGQRLFKQMYRKKRLSHANHDIHFLARSIEEWLPNAVKSLVDGTYCPQDLKRHYFEDDTVDSLHLTDRILQNILLHEIKPTFSSVMSKHCYHLHGPHGVKLASDKVRVTLEKEKPQYLIRADIKSYYASIPHYALLKDIKKWYADKKLITMLERIIHNGIEVWRGTQNPDKGIALRGPLSQFFSAMYLKPLDDAFKSMKGVTYLRYQDDILIFCQTKRQFQRGQRRLREVLRERRLSLSRKKSKQGRIDKGFHFLGVSYPAREENPPDLTGRGTQPHTHTTNVAVMPKKVPDDFLGVQSYPPPRLRRGVKGAMPHHCLRLCSVRIRERYATLGNR